LLGIIKRLKIDIVLIQFSAAAMVSISYYRALFEKLKKLKIPVLLYCHEVLQRIVVKKDIESLKLVYSLSDHFIVGNQIEKERLLSNFRVKRSKVSVIEHGVYNMFDKGKYTDEKAKEKLKLKNKKVVLFFGFIKEYKGIFTLVDAMGQVIKKNKNAFLHIAGSSNDQKLYKRLINAIKKNKLGKNVKFDNKYFSTNEIEEIYKSSDVVAMPYTSISQSGIFAAALYFKKPVVLTNVFAEANLINKRMGLVVSPKKPKELADALIYLLENKEIAEKYGKAGHDYIEKYRSWDKIALKVNSVIRRYL